MIPLNLLFKKFFLEIGPLRNLLLTLYLSNLIAISKQVEIYLFDFDVILLNPETCSKSTSIKLIFFNFFFYQVSQIDL